MKRLEQQASANRQDRLILSRELAAVPLYGPHKPKSSQILQTSFHKIFAERISELGQILRLEAYKNVVGWLGRKYSIL